MSREKLPYIEDMFGEEIRPGNIIMYATKGILKPGIIVSIEKHTNEYVSKDYFNLTVGIAGLGSTAYMPRGSSKYKSKTYYRTNFITISESNEDRFFLLHNPLFYMDRQRFKELILIADYAVDAKVLPKGYSLGDSIIEEEE